MVGYRILRYQRSLLTGKNRLLYTVSLMLLFWAIFDTVLGYLTPIIITDQGFSRAEMGLIYGTSSMAGALFDLLLSHIFKNTHFRRLYLIMFSICFIYPLILWNAKTLPVYLIAMGMWGVYFDLRNIATYDFVSRFSSHNEHSTSMAIIGMFRTIGVLISPIIAGIAISAYTNFTPVTVSLFALSISAMIYLALISMSENVKRLDESDAEKSLQKRSLLDQFLITIRISKIIMPAILLMLYISFAEAFFWTIGPLFSHSAGRIGDFEGLFMTFYILPSVFIYYIAGRASDRFGKKRSAFLSIILGSLILTLFYFKPDPLLALAITFVYSIVFTWSIPATEGIVADLLSETDVYDKEINSLADLFNNFGWIIGPPLAGILSDVVGLEHSFAVLGVIGLSIGIALYIFSPKQIDIPAL